MLKKYAYSDQKEMVRVANVKSLCRVLARISLKDQIESCPSLFTAIVFVLNDEHPEIRSYMV